jgi:hypothetical protein
VAHRHATVNDRGGRESSDQLLPDDTGECPRWTGDARIVLVLVTLTVHESELVHTF